MSKDVKIRIEIAAAEARAIVQGLTADLKGMATMGMTAGRMVTEALEGVSSASARKEVQALSRELLEMHKTSAQAGQYTTQTMAGMQQSIENCAKQAQALAASVAAVGPAANTAGKQAHAGLSQASQAAQAAAKATKKHEEYAKKCEREYSELVKLAKMFSVSFSGMKDAAGSVFGFLKDAVGTAGSAIKTLLLTPFNLVKDALVALGVAAGVTLGAIYAGMKALEPAGERQAWRAQFEVLTRSADVAEQRLEFLTGVFRRSPFELAAVIDAGKQMQALGFFSEKTFRTAADTAAAFGANLGDVVRSLGMVKAGRMGEAMETLARMGVRRDDLTAEGIKFGAKPPDIKAQTAEATAQFASITGSAQTAAERVAFLSSVFARSPFEFKDLADGARTLDMFGNFSERSFLAAANAAAATGASVSDLADALNDLKAGKAAEALSILDKIGLTQQELKAAGLHFDWEGKLKEKPVEARDKVIGLFETRYGGAMENRGQAKQAATQGNTQGEIVSSTEETLAAVERIMRRKFGGMTEKMADLWKGALSTLKGDWLIMWEAVGADSLPYFSKAVQAMSDILKMLTEQIKTLDLSWVGKEFLAIMTTAKQVVASLFDGYGGQKWLAALKAVPDLLKAGLLDAAESFSNFIGDARVGKAFSQLGGLIGDGLFQVIDKLMQGRIDYMLACLTDGITQIGQEFAKTGGLFRVGWKVATDSEGYGKQIEAERDSRRAALRQQYGIGTYSGKVDGQALLDALTDSGTARHLRATARTEAPVIGQTWDRFRLNEEAAARGGYGPRVEPKDPATARREQQAAEDAKLREKIAGAMDYLSGVMTRIEGHYQRTSDSMDGIAAALGSN